MNQERPLPSLAVPLLAVVLLASIFQPTPAAAAASNRISSREAFEKMKSLAGRWSITDEECATQDAFEIVAGGQAVAERSRPCHDDPRKGYLIVYYVDHDALMLTLFSDDGNQPRLRAAGDGLQAARFEFDYFDGTNMVPGAGRMEKAVFELRDASHVQVTWSGVGGDGTPVVLPPFSLVREPAR